MSAALTSLAHEPLLQRIVRWGSHNGPIGVLRRARYDRRFANASGKVRIFRGIFDSYDAAAASAPATHPIGSDNAASVQRLQHEGHRVFSSDYPTLFWLSRLLRDDGFVFELHGNVGTGYFAFRRVLPFPANLTWLVHDVPAIVAQGRSLARNEDAPGLRFAKDLSELSRANILLIKGAVQFLRDPIALLNSSGRLPQHVLVNKIPIYDREPAVTLQANGVAFSPYHLINRRQFTNVFEKLGYRMIDTWLNYDLNCYIPFYPEHTIPRYSGYYFTRDPE